MYQGANLSGDKFLPTFFLSAAKVRIFYEAANPNRIIL